VRSAMTRQPTNARVMRGAGPWLGAGGAVGPDDYSVPVGRRVAMEWVVDRGSVR
jgi:hypothetical protein